MDIIEALRTINDTLGILRDTDRHAGCSDRVYRQIMVAKINGLMASGACESVSAAIAALENQPTTRSKKG